MTEGYRAGDRYSYRSVSTLQMVTWTRDADGVWSSPDRTMTCDDAEVDKQRALDESDPSAFGEATFVPAVGNGPDVAVK